MSKVTGVDDVKARFDALSAKVGIHVADAVLMAAKMVEGTAKQSIIKQSPGREVTRYTTAGRPYPHIAAAAGQPPNNDTGLLAASIATQVMGTSAYVGVISDTSDAITYAAALELGTGDMQPRPYLRPALDKHRDAITRMITDAAAKGTR